MAGILKCLPLLLLGFSLSQRGSSEKFRLIESEGYFLTLHQKPLHQMLSLARGSWRNAVYIECTSCPYRKELCRGHLLLIDADGTPILFSVSYMEKALGETIEKTECVATLTRSAFEHLYNRWLIWNINDTKECSIQQLLS